MIPRILLSVSDCTNNTSNIDCTSGDNIAVSVMALCLGIILALSVTTNGILCFVFYKKPNLLSVSNRFVLNLCCCELGLSVLVLPFTLASVFSSGTWIFNEIWCKMQGYLFTVFIISLQLSLLIIAVDRNYAIINSLRYLDVFTPRLANGLVAMCWILSMILAIPPLIGVGNYHYVHEQYTCAIDWSVEQHGFLLAVTVLSFVLPLFVQALCYLSIFKAAISHTKRASKIYPVIPSTLREINSNIRDPPSDTSDSSEVSASIHVRYRNMECKAVRTIMLIAAAYTICWVPYFTVSFTRLRTIMVNSHADSVAIICIFLSGVINPIIYAFMNRITRHEINKFFCGVTHRDSRKTSSANDSDEYGSTTATTQFSGPNTRASSSSGSSKTRSGSRTESISRVLEMKTIEEEVEIENVFRTVNYDQTCNFGVSNLCQDKVTRNKELNLSPSELLLHRTSIRCKREHLTSIKEETCSSKTSISNETQSSSSSTPHGKSGRFQHLEALDGVWSPASKFYSSDLCKDPSARNVRRDETFVRAQRDCGSFLYFEKPTHKPSDNTRSDGKPGRRYGGRFSIDESSLRHNVGRVETAPKSPSRHHSIHQGMKNSLMFVLPDHKENNLNTTSSSSTSQEATLNNDLHSTCTEQHDDATQQNSGCIRVNAMGERNCMSA